MISASVFFCLLLVFILVYSYFVFPTTLIYFPTKQFQKEENHRKISIVISAYNEERNIEGTLRALLKSASIEQINSIIVGDDGSKDKTVEIVQSLAKECKKIVCQEFNRIGKPQILNALAERNNLCTSGHYIIFLDANILVDENAIAHLLNEIQQMNVGAVGASVYPLMKETNLEVDYILRENRIKAEESRGLGYAIGLFGACFMIRGELFRKIPPNFITDDLFLSLNTVELGYNVLYSPTAKVYENISADIQNEVNRKKRYAAGNFQILFRFWKLFLPWKSSIGFVYAYTFHKVIRWIAPVLFFIIWILSIAKAFGRWNSCILWGGTSIFLFLFLNYLLYQSNRSVLWKRMNYFLMMNLAILLGFFNFIKGVKSSIWERSERV